MSELGSLGSLNPTVNKNGQMGVPKPVPIRLTLHAVGHNLKDKLANLLEINTWQPLLIRANQSEIQNFGSEASSTTPQDGSPEITSPAETQSPPSPDDSGDPGASDPEEQEDKSVAIIYVRVSSNGQVRTPSDSGTVENESGDVDKGSIQGQISQLKKLAETNDMAVPYDPIVDEAQTGTNFDRDGIRRVFEIAKRDEIDYLLVEKIDRIGRNAAETLYFIWMLQNQCGVTILTPSGEHNVNQVEGLMQTTLLSLMAEVQNQIRTDKATNERIRGFLKGKNWSCLSPKIPLGYAETDSGWIEIDPEEEPIVREIFRKFVECETYTETEAHIEEEFGSNVLDGHQLKTILQESAYIGKPKVPEQWIVDTQFSTNELDEPELNILGGHHDQDCQVSEETYHEAQRIIESNKRENDGEDDTYSVTDFVDEFGLFPIVESSDLVRLVHHCGEPMVKDGQANLAGNFDITTHSYKCPSCEEKVDADSYYRKWPNESEINNIEIIDKVLSDDKSLFASDEDEENDSDADADE
jgi:DNA invertase Pin-like site-specific DNA recombinase